MEVILGSNSDLDRADAVEGYLNTDMSNDIVFDRITSFAKRLFRVEVAIIGMIEKDQCWLKSAQGMEIEDLGGAEAFCHRTVSETNFDVLVVLDALEDPRFSRNQLVVFRPYVRFFAGVPLIVEGGFKVGALCIMSFERRQSFSLRQKMDLIDLASLVVDELKLRRNLMKHSLKYIASTSHDLKTPLFCFSLCLELLGNTSLTEEQRSLLDHTMGNIELMQWTIDSAQAASKCEVANCEYRPDGKELNVRELVEKIQKSAEHFPRSVPLIFEVDENAPQTIFSDAACIVHSVFHFITHSCKFSKVGHIKVSVAPSLERSGFTRFTVDDTGPDIDNPEALFKASIQSYHGTESPADENTYELGNTQDDPRLHSVPLHMKAIGGYYGHQKRTDLQQGSKYWIDVPNVMDTSAPENCTEEDNDYPIEFNQRMMVAAGIDPSNEAGNIDLELVSKFCENVEDSGAKSTTAMSCLLMPNLQTSESRALAKSFSKQTSLATAREKQETARCSPPELEVGDRALVIDDNATIQKMLKVILQKHGFIVDTASHGQEGLYQLKAKTYILVYCDFLMPILSGPECIKQYMDWRTENNIKTPRPFIVGISANADNQDVAVGLKAGMDFFQEKPVKPKTIAEISQKAREFIQKAKV